MRTEKELGEALKREEDTITIEGDLVKKVIKKEVATMYKGLNLASHATIIAVKPILLALSVLIEWLMPLARSKPTSPQMAPDKTKVLIITFLTLIPIYFAVFSDSPTTVNS